MTALEDRPGASPDGLPPLRDVIREMGLSAKKSLGQNFILDLNLTRRIARLAGPLEGRTVVEVGPGPGGLTRALLIEGAERVVVVERDDRCLPVLHAIAERYPGRLDIHMGDALAVDWPKLIGLADTRQASVGLADTRQAGVGLADTRQAGVGPAEKTKIVANLPYGVATMLLIGWLETEPWPPWFDRMALMFQKEVAERIVAEPGSRAYGRLAVISQWRTIPKLALTLPPAAFTPPPKVASAVVEFTPRPDPQPACSVKILGQVTAAAFGQRRKMLRASLKQLTPFPELLLKEASIDPQLRGEALSVADFARLAQVVERMRGAD